MAKSSIREFRKSIAALKKVGLVSKRVDARSVKPTNYWRKKLTELGPVLRGEAEPIVIDSKEDRAEYERRGYKTVKRKIVLVKKAPDETVHVEHGTVVRETKTGIQYVELPANIHDAEKLEAWMRRNEIRIQSLLKPGDRFSFSFYGNHSIESFHSFDLLIDTLIHYETWQDYEDSDDPKQQSSMIENIVIMRVPRGINWNPTAKKMEYRGGATKAQRKRYIKRMKKDVYRYSEYKAKQAEAAKKYRAGIRAANPEKFAAYKEAAAKRARKSRKKK